MGIVQVYKQEILITKFRFFTFIDIISIIIIQVYALILAHSAWIAPITAADETWLPLHNYFLQGTIFTALLCLARQIPLIRCIWIGWLVGYLSTEIDLLDGALHGLLAQTGIYRFVGNATFEQNPQYGIITMALVVIFSILLQLSFRKFRRLSLVMGAVYLLIQFTIAFVNHKIYPSGIMKDVIQERAALVMSSKNLDKKNFRFFCETHLLGCRTKANGQIKEVFTPLHDLDEEQQIQMEKLKERIDLSTPTYYLETNKLRAQYLTFVDLNTSITYEIVDQINIDKIWKLSLGYFYRTCYIVANLWFAFISILAFIHRNVVWFK